MRISDAGPVAPGGFGGLTEKSGWAPGRLCRWVECVKCTEKRGVGGPVGFVLEGRDLPRTPSWGWSMTSRIVQFQIFLDIREATSPPDTDDTAKHSGNAVITKIHKKTCLRDPGRRVRRCGDTPGG